MIDRFLFPMCRSVSRVVRGVLSDDRAGVGIIAALSVPVVIGSAGLVVDLNQGLQQRVINQRAADMAALGAAMAYKASATGGGQPNAAVLSPTAEDIVRINGAVGADVTATVETLDAQEVVKVVVVTEVPYTL